MKLMVREGFREQKPKGSEKARFADTSRKRILCSMNSKYKGFEGKHVQGTAKRPCGSNRVNKEENNRK